MNKIETVFGGKVRVRVCGICFEKDRILLVKHNMGGKPFYAPPGGAIEFGENILSTLIREFKEETNLNIVPDRQLFITEFVKPPLHAIEIFFLIKSWNGTLEKGSDPEINDANFIEEVAFYSPKEIREIPMPQLHHILYNYAHPKDLLALSGLILYPSYIKK